MRHHSPFHRGRHGHEDAFREHRGRRGRMFDGTGLRLVLLKLIEEQPRHGYDLIREVEARAGGAYAPSPGMVYPMTTLMLDMGLVQETGGEAGRKLFAITDLGRAELATNVEAVEAAFAKLQSLADIRGRTDAAPVVRAMDNLKVAIRNRLSAEGVEAAVILEVAALIDQAAGKIERVGI